MTRFDIIRRLSALLVLQLGVERSLTGIKLLFLPHSWRVRFLEWQWMVYGHVRRDSKVIRREEQA